MEPKPHVRFGIDSSEVPIGSHVCLLYRNESERDSITIPFIREGIGDSASCKYVADEQTAAHLRQSLVSAGVAVAAVEASGQFSILTATQTYLANDAFNYHEMIVLLDQLAQETVSAGYPYLRYTGEATFLLSNAPGFDDFMEYESVLNRYLPSLPMVVLCQYNVTKFDGGIVLGALQTHPYAVMGGVLIKNPYFVPPECFVGSRLTARE